jgi:catechol 2,3-dioxygenase-like lactoylglutathione lyase family enzyme
MIYGAHVILYSADPDADRAFFSEVLEYPSVDAGHNWLIFRLPPAELAVHPVEARGGHELFLMCDDIGALVQRMTALAGALSEPSVERWGSITRMTLPGGGTLGVYQPSHPSPITTS